MNLDLLVAVLVNFPDEVVHLPHQLEVAEGQLVRGDPEHVPHGCERPGETRCDATQQHTDYRLKIRRPKSREDLL